MNKKHLISIICLFLAIIIVPSGISIAKGQNDFSEKENRALQTRPSISFSDIMDGSFQKDYETYLSDQFMLRDFWVNTKTKAFRLLGKKDINNVYIGKDGYLIEKYTDSSFDSNQMKVNEKLLCDFLNDRASENKYNSVSCVFVPSKGTVLTNKMPNGAIDYNSDYVVENIQKNLNTGINSLYLKDTLVVHNDEYIFYRTDHHWTSLGAFYGYNAYRNLVGENEMSVDDYNQVKVSDNDFLGTDYDKIQIYSKKDDISIFEPKSSVALTVDYNGEKDMADSIYINENLDIKDKYTYFLGGNYKKINIKTNVNNGKKLLLIKDSYSNSLVPFLANDYSEIVMLDLRYSPGKVNKIIEEEGNITDILVIYNTEKFMNDNHQFALK